MPVGGHQPTSRPGVAGARATDEALMADTDEVGPLTIKAIKDWLEIVEIVENDAFSCVKAYGFDPGNQKVWFYADGEIAHLEHISEVTRFKIKTYGLCLTYADDDTEAHEALLALHEACDVEDTVAELRDLIGEFPDD